MAFVRHVFLMPAQTASSVRFGQTIADGALTKASVQTGYGGLRGNGYVAVIRTVGVVAENLGYGLDQYTFRFRRRKSCWGEPGRCTVCS